MLKALAKTSTFYSHVICSGTKITMVKKGEMLKFYSHVICSGTKINPVKSLSTFEFYSHVICSGTKISNTNVILRKRFTVT